MFSNTTKNVRVYIYIYIHIYDYKSAADNFECGGRLGCAGHVFRSFFLLLTQFGPNLASKIQAKSDQKPSENCMFFVCLFLIVDNRMIGIELFCQCNCFVIKFSIAKADKQTDIKEII